MNDDFSKLPDNLPIPENDGAANHLLGQRLPHMTLPSTKYGTFDFSNIDRQYGVLYFFPLMAMPGNALPPNWNDTPGARGCTPQNISFSENNTAIEKFGAISIGISSQPLSELQYLASKRKLTQTLVSDGKFEFQKKLNVPVFHVDGKMMYKRLTLIVKKSKIVRVFYPVFPPDMHVFEVLRWLDSKKT